MKTGQKTGLVSPPGDLGMETEPFISRSIGDSVALGDDEVHVWRASLHSSSGGILDLWRTLSPDEKQRALNFRFQKDCDRFIVGRGLLRATLGGYLDRAPDQILFSYSEYGKPSLSETPGNDSLEFNLSHADALALLALTRRRKVGVDIERVRPDFETDGVAQQFFSAKEQDDLRSLTEEVRRKAFFTCWTRKEAFVKARGVGLSLPLDQFDVSLMPQETAAVLRVRGDGEDASNWALKDIPMSVEYVAALAVEGHDWNLQCWQASPLNMT